MFRIILVIGTGRCGLVSMLNLLSQQPKTKATLEESPLLPWQRQAGDRVIRERFARFRRSREADVVVDTAAFYLPYLEDAIAVEPDLRVIALKRPRENVEASFVRFLDEYNTFP